MILPHEVDRVIEKCKTGQPLDSSDTNAIELYDIAGFHRHVLDEARRKFQTLIKPADFAVIQTAPAHPQPTEQQLELQI